MLERSREQSDSRLLALRLYDGWLRERQGRADFLIPKDEKEIEELRLRNLATQNILPRRQHLEQLREVGDEVLTADKVALIAMLELPTLELSTLLHRLSLQLAADPEAVYFSPTNQADNCGCGCGCACAMLAELPYEERIGTHRQLKPFSVDPFNESGIPEKERDALLITDFLESYEALSGAVTERIQARYFAMGREFGG